MIYKVYVWETRKAVKNIVDGKDIEFSTYEAAKKFAVECEAITHLCSAIDTVYAVIGLTPIDRR